MERCTNCQNILPRTVDRCPVCGQDIRAEADAETFEVPDVPEGKDFLEAVSVQRSEPAPVRSGMSRPKRRTASRTTEAEKGAVAETSDASSRTSDFELPAKEAQTRSVAAISSRLNSNIRIGPKKSHSALVVAAVVVALTTLSAGTAVGYQRSEAPETIAMASVDIPIRPTDEPLVVTGDVERFRPGAIVAIDEPAACGSPVDTFGAVVEGGTVIAPLVSVENADIPLLSNSDVLTTGDVLGISNPNDLAVIRPADRLATRLGLATNTTIRPGVPVALVGIAADGEITLRPGSITSFEDRQGLIYSFEVGENLDAEDETLGLSYPRGTFVLNSSGDLLGMAGNDGQFVTAARLTESASRWQSEPSFPEPSC